MAKKLTLNNRECRQLLKNHTKEIVHLRQQLSKQRFGLVFGAGIVTDLGFPKWDELLKRISEHSEIDGSDILSKWANSTSLAQQLFQRYRTLRTDKATADELQRNMLEMRIRAGWRSIVHDCLYQGISPSISQTLKKDQYLKTLVPLIQRSPLTVTYNFDDTLQRTLAKSKGRAPDEKGYITYWSGNVQLNARDGGVIYHPNGFLPYHLSEKPSDNLVFLEDSFVDQLIDSMAGQYASLATHISRTTCLFIGLSLSDPGLKHLLRQNAKAFPGHYHYYVSFVKDKKGSNQMLRRLEADANFDVYNLITLHLTAKQINALATLLAASDQEFNTCAEEVTTGHSFKYYLNP